jgi:RNA polymerase sigma-70 factor (ECF subfamily)
LIAQGLPDHIARLWRFAMVRCADRATADDLVQATCVRALERADQFTPGSRLDNWLFAILDSIWQNARRAQGVRSGNGLIDVAEAELASGDADEETRLQVVDTVRLIAALPEGQRSVLLLVCIEGLSYEEVAQLLAIPVGTVMSRLSSARSRMRMAFSA